MFKLTVGHVDTTALFITLCLVSIEMALLARVLSNLSYCNIHEIGTVGSMFAPPCDPQEQELLVLTPVLPDDELGDPFSFVGVHSSPTHAQCLCSTYKSCWDLWSLPYQPRAVAL